jgi:hypothetical protein
MHNVLFSKHFTRCKFLHHQPGSPSDKAKGIDPIIPKKFQKSRVIIN